MLESTKHLLYQDMADRLAELIQQGTYPPGSRIPSVRQTSEQNGVSISTVLQAYSLLESQGLIEARPQSGYYVRRQAAMRLPEPEMSAAGRDPSLVSIHELTMMLLADTLDPSLVQLGAALPNPQLMPTKKINRILGNVLRQNADNAHQYQFPPGWEPLRTQIAQRAVIGGCSLSPSDILITSGGIEAIDLCLHAVCRPGDIVATESPMYFGTLQTLEVQGLRALEIPTHPREGISVSALAFALEHNPIRAVLVISNFNNPLGSMIPDEKKRELVELLARYEVPLIENDVSGEIYFGEKRPMVCKAFDQKGLVMLVSSFSKDISPGLRIGWVAAGRYLAEATWLKSTIQRGITDAAADGSGAVPGERRLRPAPAANPARVRAERGAAVGRGGALLPGGHAADPTVGRLRAVGAAAGKRQLAGAVQDGTSSRDHAGPRLCLLADAAIPQLHPAQCGRVQLFDRTGDGEAGGHDWGDGQGLARRAKATARMKKRRPVVSAFFYRWAATHISTTDASTE